MTWWIKGPVSAQTEKGGERHLYTAELVPYLLPALVAYTRRTPEHIVRVNCALNGQQARVVIPPEGLLEVRLVGIGLERERSGS